MTGEYIQAALAIVCVIVMVGAAIYATIKNAQGDD